MTTPTMGLSSIATTPGGLLRLLVIFAALCSAIGWNYENEEIWPATCGSGKYQSPINLQRHKAEVSKFSPFEFMNYDKYNLATLTNNGHSVQVVLVNPEKKPSVTGGGLPGEYIFDHLHFHWSAEHTVYSNRYSLEMHMVHYSAKYNSTAAAVASGSQQAVAVIGVLFDIMDRYEQITKSFSKPFINALRKVKNSPGTPVELTTAIAIKDFFPEDITGFYRYEGSLTTPTCDEVVIWTIFTGLGYISEEQLKEFHSIHSDHGLLSHNYRAMQELNDRIVSLRKSTYNGQKNISAHYEFILMLFLTTYFINNKA